MRLCSIIPLVLLLSSFHHERDIFVTTTFGDIVSFCCLRKTSQAFSRERTTFSIANFDYKTIQDFTRKQCQLKSTDQVNTHTHTQDDCFTLASRLRVAQVKAGSQYDALFVCGSITT